METAVLITLAVSGIYALYFIITYRIACDHVVCYGHFYRGRIELGFLFTVLSIAQLLLAFTNYKISRKNKWILVSVVRKDISWNKAYSISIHGWKTFEFSVLPVKFEKIYFFATFFTVLFFIVTLFLIRGLSLQNMLMILYSGIITPVFEEILFRGTIWNKLRCYIKKEWKIYLLVTALFGLWHMEYWMYLDNNIKEGVSDIFTLT